MSERCEHGVWMGDLCYACEREKTADDVARLRRQVDEAVECCIIKDDRNLRLEAELTALKRAAWDAHDTVSAMLDNNEAEDSKAIRKVLDEMGELLPAKRPVSNSRTVHGGSPMTLREVMEAEERTPERCRTRCESGQPHIPYSDDPTQCMVCGATVTVPVAPEAK